MKLFEMIARVIAWVSIIGVILLITGIAYWLLYPYKTTVILNEPVPVVNFQGKVKAGEALRLHHRAIKYTDVGADVSRMLVNDKTREKTLIYSGTSVMPSGEHDDIISIQIPSWVPPGRRKLRTTYEYQVNPLRVIAVSWESQEFEIVK